YLDLLDRLPQCSLPGLIHPPGRQELFHAIIELKEGYLIPLGKLRDERQQGIPHRLDALAGHRPTPVDDQGKLQVGTPELLRGDRGGEAEVDEEVVRLIVNARSIGVAERQAE